MAKFISKKKLRSSSQERLPVPQWCDFDYAMFVPASMLRISFVHTNPAVANPRTKGCYLTIKWSLFY